MAEKKNLISEVKEKFSSLTPKKQRQVVVTTVCCFLVIVGGMGYKSRQGEKKANTEVKVKKGKLKDISIDQDLMEKTLLTEQRNKLEKLYKDIQELKSGRKALDSGANFDNIDDMLSIKDAKDLGDGSESEGVDGDDYFEMPSSDIAPTNGVNPLDVSRPPVPSGAPMPAQPMVVGDIVINQNADYEALKAKRDQKLAIDKKKADRQVYLPPSFMEATLLTGIDAPTSGSGKTNPVPMLLRISKLSILPNEVKASLRGCFVLAEGVGDLSKERVDVRLLSLSCLSKKDESVIDQSVKGFVVDGDGKVGLSGRVVSRMGTAVARAAVTGLFSGFGEALDESSQIVVGEGDNTQTIVDPSKAGQLALGKGLSNASDKLQDFYLSLSKQAVPVIETQGLKKITIVISEGVSLKIKDIDSIGE